MLCFSMLYYYIVFLLLLLFSITLVFKLSHNKEHLLSLMFLLYCVHVCMMYVHAFMHVCVCVCVWFIHRMSESKLYEYILLSHFILFGITVFLYSSLQKKTSTMIWEYVLSLLKLEIFSLNSSNGASVFIKTASVKISSDLMQTLTS